MKVVPIFTINPASSVPDPKPLAAADAPPPWRQYARKPASDLIPRAPRPMDKDQADRGLSYRGKAGEADLVNAALFLRRPLLITGNAGVGKSTLAYAVAQQLGLGNVLRWGSRWNRRTYCARCRAA